VRYTVLLGGKDVSKDYHISGYPTMYLIDKNGKIVYAISGYGIGVEAILENYILQTL
jgi:thioredoxin-related protein